MYSGSLLSVARSLHSLSSDESSSVAVKETEDEDEEAANAMVPAPGPGVLQVREADNTDDYDSRATELMLFTLFIYLFHKFINFIVLICSFIYLLN